MSQPWHISVLIPARNEEQLLPRCLRSVLAACSVLPEFVTHDIVVAIDSSTDRSRCIAERMLYGQGTVVSTNCGIVGTARALAAEVALQRSPLPPDHCWLANTDADCSVPQTWLSDHLAFAHNGIEAIAGMVDVDSFHEHRPGVRELFQSRYLIHPDGKHPHVHGANIGVRADAYLRAGGWRPLATAEDHDLWNRLHHAGSHRVSAGRMRVTTSGRRTGRAPLGFAGTLTAFNEAIT